MRGDATLFTRNDEVEAQWRICDPIVKYWASIGEGLAYYESGSQGPSDAERLLREGHRWRAI
jgi:glucose-6-phosphate 1-dehydrogenase